MEEQRSMTREKIDQRLFDLYDEYAHGRIDRREFMRRAGMVVGAASAATAVQALLPRYAEAETVSFNDPRIRASWIEYPSPSATGRVRAYLVRPIASAAHQRPAVLVIHENRGLNPYIQDVARRAAVEGFLALAPDGLSAKGGYPGNDDEGRELQAQIPPEQLEQDMLAGAQYLKAHPDCSGRLGAVGFCWGGGMVGTLAVKMQDGLDAGVPFYGRQPAAGDVAKIRAPLLIHYAELDARINDGWPAFEGALEANDVEYTMPMDEVANHGFHNHSTPRYDEAAAELAWSRTIAFFREHLE
jgi:carboxymethylenebutenolidase